MNKIDISEFEAALKNHLDGRKRELEHSAAHLIASVEYSIFSGGKRFRPQIIFSAVPLFNLSATQLIPWAMAIECVHTYSLIHDDLPCMDNDDYRRGQPTNHKVFGESTALLAGDALLTEAFYIVTKYYDKTPDIASQLGFLLSQASGLTGMVAGQAMDLAMQTTQELNENQLKRIHMLKTAALIVSAVSGVAVIARADESQKSQLKIYGQSLGMAFQIADDILDFNPQNPEATGFPKLMGLEKTQELLKAVTAEGLQALSAFGEKALGLQELLTKNISRKK